LTELGIIGFFVKKAVIPDKGDAGKALAVMFVLS